LHIVIFEKMNPDRKKNAQTPYLSGLLSNRKFLKESI